MNRQRRVNAIPRAPRGTCRHCRKPVEPPKINWCSDECVTEALILKGDPNTVRREVFKRDKGVCAKCGLDTQAAHKAWDADHILPVVEGGGGCGLENYRTLCVPCHKVETAALAKRRAQRRREAECPLLLESQTGEQG